MVRLIVTVHSSRPDTIWNVLAARLGREPTSQEAADECRRILSEARAARLGA